MDGLFFGEQEDADGDSIHPRKHVENELHNFLGLNKLELDYLLHWFLKIKFVVVITTLQEENGIVQIIESLYFLLIWLSGQASDLFADDEVLEVHIEVLYLPVFLLVQLFFVSKIDLGDQFLFDIMEVIKFHFCKVLILDIWKYW